MKLPMDHTQQSKGPVKRLRDVVPREFHAEFSDSRAARYLDEAVIAEKEFGWPGDHKHVVAWWVLGNGHAVGWNENPGRGWSFPVVALKGAVVGVEPSVEDGDDSLVQSP